MFSRIPEFLSLKCVSKLLLIGYTKRGRTRGSTHGARFDGKLPQTHTQLFRKCIRNHSSCTCTKWHVYSYNGRYDEQASLLCKNCRSTSKWPYHGEALCTVNICGFDLDVSPRVGLAVLLSIAEVLQRYLYLHMTFPMEGCMPLPESASCCNRATSHTRSSLCFVMDNLRRLPLLLASHAFPSRHS